MDWSDWFEPDPVREFEEFWGKELKRTETIAKLQRNDTIFPNGNGGMRLNSVADPMADVFGAGEESDPEKIDAFKMELVWEGVELVEHESETLAYSPGLAQGKPGTVYVSSGASYSAWLHEMQHMRDDRDAGWLGMRVFADPDQRYEWETRAYKVEIDLALSFGRTDIADKLIENLEAERRIIYGESFD